MLFPNNQRNARHGRMRMGLVAILLPTAGLCQTTLAAPPAIEARPSALTNTTPDAAPAEPVTLDRVQAIGVRYDARRDDTAARVIVNQAELTRFGDTSLIGALKRLPGIVVTPGAPGSGGRLSLRGMAGYTQILVDGQAAPAGIDPDLLSPEMVERVEIMRTTTADLRAEAIAGTVNIVLARTARTDASELKFALGVSNDQWLPMVSWTQSRRSEYGGHKLAISAGRRSFLVEEDGIEAGISSTEELNLLRTTGLRVEGHRDSLSLSSGINHTLVNGATLAISGYLDASSYDKHGDIEWNTSVGPELEHVRYRQYTGIDVVQLRTDGAWTQEFERAGKLAAKVSVGGNREQYRFREQGYNAFGALNLDDVTGARLRVFNATTTGKHSLPTLGAHTIELGWDASQDSRSEHRHQTLATVAGYPEAVSDLSFDTRVRRVAAYVQDDWSVTPDWSLYLGGRWERIDTTSDGSGLNPVRAASAIFSPVLQSLWKPPGPADDRLRVGLAKTYRAPTARALSARPYTSTNNRPLNPDQEGNPALRPELAIGLDLAYERSWSDTAMVSLGAYLKEIDQLIRNETRLRDGRWINSPVNGGKAMVRGLEFEVRAPLPGWMGAARDLDVRFNAGRHWSSVGGVAEPHNRIAGQPSFVATLAVDWASASTWSAGGSFSYRSADAVQITSLEASRSSPRRELDLYALWSLSQHSKLRMSLSDALQQDTMTGSRYQLDDGYVDIDRTRQSHLTLRAALEIRL